MAQTFTEPINSNDQSLDRVLNAGLPVALVFENGTSDLDGTLSRLARENAGQLLVVKIKAADNPQSARRFQVNGLPAAVMVKGGQAISQSAPASPAQVEQHVAYLLGKGPKPAQASAGGAKTGGAGTGAARTGAAGAASGGEAGSRGEPVVVSEASFEEQVLRSAQPVLIDFWAPWCGPCRMVAPTVEKLAAEMNGRLRVVKINTDENQNLMNKFGIQGIPTMMIFKGGQLVDRWTGALPEGAIRQHLKQKLGL